MWLLDQEIENAIIIIKLQKIVKLITIIILYNDNIINIFFSIFIYEILYKYKGY